MRIRIIKNQPRNSMDSRSWWYDYSAYIGKEFDVRKVEKRRYYLADTPENLATLQEVGLSRKPQELLKFCFVADKDCIDLSIEDNESALRLLSKKPF